MIFYRNIFRQTGAVITSSGDDTGFSAASVAEYRSFKGWQSSLTTSPVWINVDVTGAGLNADSLIIVNGNLQLVNGANVKVYADSANPPTGVTVMAATAVLNDAVDYHTFTAPGAKRYWRVEFSDPAPPFAVKPFVGEILLGMKLTMTEYVAPDMDPRGHDIEAADDRSEGGHWLGSRTRGIIRRGTLRFGGAAGVTRTQFTSDLRYFLESCYRRLLPFAFVLDADDSEFSRAWWIKKPKDARTPNLPVADSYGRFTFDLPFEEAMVEGVFADPVI